MKLAYHPARANGQEQVAHAGEVRDVASFRVDQTLQLQEHDRWREDDRERETEVLRERTRNTAKEPHRNRRARAREATERQAETLDHAYPRRRRVTESLEAAFLRLGQTSAHEDQGSGRRERDRHERQNVEEAFDFTVRVTEHLLEDDLLDRFLEAEADDAPCTRSRRRPLACTNRIERSGRQRRKKYASTASIVPVWSITRRNVISGELGSRPMSFSATMTCAELDTGRSSAAPWMSARIRTR